MDRAVKLWNGSSTDAIFIWAIWSLVCISMSDKTDTGASRKKEECSDGSDLHSFNPL